MKKCLLIITVLMFLIPVAVQGVNYWDYLTKQRADTLYCPKGGNCNMTNLEVMNLTVYGAFLNVTVTNVNINATNITDAPWVLRAGDNITGNMNHTGNKLTDVGELIVDSITLEGNLIPQYDGLSTIGNSTNKLAEIWTELLYANNINATQLNTTEINTDTLDANDGNITNINTIEINIGNNKIIKEENGDISLIGVGG